MADQEDRNRYGSDSLSIDDADTVTSVSTTTTLAPVDNETKNDAIYVFKWLVLAQIILYAEAGAVPALLDQISTAFTLNYNQLGLLGGIVYIGISLAAPAVSRLFICSNPKTVLGVSLVLNTGFTALFGMVPESYAQTFIATRFFIGTTQSVLAVFCPVWVDVFSTDAHQTAWFSALQASVPLGVLFGYALGFIAAWLHEHTSQEGYCVNGMLACWRLPFAVQVCASVPLCIRFFFIPASHLQILHVAENGGGVTLGSRSSRADEDKPFGFEESLEGSKKAFTGEGLSRVRADSSFLYTTLEDDNKAKRGCGSQLLKELYQIVSTPLFSLTVLCLCALFFVVTGVQFWGTEFLIRVMEGGQKQVMIMFMLTSATGPIFGVLLGGYLTDKMGGYKGSSKQRLVALKTVLACAGFANAAAVLACAAVGAGMYVSILGLWLLLFFGGACLPALTGIFIDAVRPESRALASSLSQIAFNILGYFCAPFISGAAMQFFASSGQCEDYRDQPGKCPYALLWGFRVVLSFSGLALLLIMSIVIYQAFKVRKDTKWPGLLDPVREGSSLLDEPPQYNFIDES